jgi:hypothetical protein
VAPRRGGAHGPPLCEIIAISHRPILLTLSPVETRLTIPIDRVPCTSQLGVFLFSFRPPFKLIGQPHFSPRPTTDWHGRSESRQKARVVRDLAPAGPEPVGVGGGGLGVGRGTAPRVYQLSIFFAHDKRDETKPAFAKRRAVESLRGRLD